MQVIDKIFELLERHGDEHYVADLVTQRAHALQAAALAEAESAPPAMVAAALLHDIGHLLRREGMAADADYHHEELAKTWLSEHFGPDVTEPVRLHVYAKRYLCAVDKHYTDQLTPGSVRSLTLQGGPLSDEEVDAFEVHPFREEAVWLRRVDDRAKVPGLPVPDLEDFRVHLEEVLPALEE